MRKTIVVAVVILLLVALAVPVAYAAISDQQRDEINRLYQQMFDLRKQVIDQYVEGGEITPEQAQVMKSNLDYMQQNHADGLGMMGAGGCGGGVNGNNGTLAAPSGYRSGGGMMGGYSPAY